MTTAGGIPVFMRVGDSQEFEIGTVSPDLDLSEADADGQVKVKASLRLAEFLHAVADEVEQSAE